MLVDDEPAPPIRRMVRPVGVVLGLNASGPLRSVGSGILP